jgi:hypothetical protein
MLDYIFFAPSLTDKFKTRLTQANIPFVCEKDENFGSVQGDIISISDETDEQILSDLQDFYDELQDELAHILEQGEDALSMNAAGMSATLNDGSLCTLRVSPEIVSRILSVLEFSELQAFVDDIASSVQTPDSGHFCHHKEEKK